MGEPTPTLDYQPHKPKRPIRWPIYLLIGVGVAVLAAMLIHIGISFYIVRTW